MEPLRLEDVPESERLYEIVDGKKIWLPLRSVYSSVVCQELVWLVHAHAERKGLGEAYLGLPYEMPVGSRTVRRPTGSFVSTRRWNARGPSRLRAEGNHVCSELVIEVQGFDDFAETTMEKLHEYLRCGVSLVWIVYPLARSVYAYTTPNAVRIFSEQDTLDGGDILPGFSVPLASLFPPMAPEPARQ